MDTPLWRNRPPLADVTPSSNTRSSRVSLGTKRDMPSPSPSSGRAASGAALRSLAATTTPPAMLQSAGTPSTRGRDRIKRRVLSSAEIEQRPELTALWNTAVGPAASSIALLKTHNNRLQAVVDFANLEREFSA